MEETYFKKITITFLLASLLLLSFFLLKPLLLSILIGVLLAFLFVPVNRKINRFIKNKNISAFLVCILVFIIIFLPLWFLTPIIVEQSIKVYMFSQQIDYVTSIQKLFPSISLEASREIGNNLQLFITKMTNSLMNIFSQVLLYLPILFLQLLVTTFTFFYILRDEKKLLTYILELSPFSKEINKRLFDSTKDITSSIIYGQFVVGIIQGLLVGLGLFIFDVPNALLLTFFAIILGILPIIGTTIIWLPVVIYLFIGGNSFEAIGVTIFGLLSNIVDNFLRPIIISKRTAISSPIILIGMIGGLFLFGALGLILGPLILAYLLIFFEVYKNNKSAFSFLNEKKA